MATVTGPAVTLDGTAVEGATVSLINNETGEPLAKTTTDASGNWSLTVADGLTVHARVRYMDSTGELHRTYSKPFVVANADPA